MLTDERCKQLMTDLGMPNSQFLYSALQQVANEVEQATRAEVRAEAQEQVAIVGELCAQSRAEVLAKGHAVGAYLYAAPQPPAPCSKCAENVQDAIDWMKRALKTEGERDALQANVAELETEAAENCRIIGMSGEREARHLARIAELEKVAQAYEDQVAEHNKTLDELARLAELIDEQKGTIRALNMALGGDGSPSTENLIDANEIDAGGKGLIALCREQSALIVLCESALTTTIANSPEPYCAITRRIRAEQEDAIAAIAAQKGGAA